VGLPLDRGTLLCVLTFILFFKIIKVKTIPVLLSSFALKQASRKKGEGGRSQKCSLSCLCLGAISFLGFLEKLHVSPIGVVLKKNGGSQLIINMRLLNVAIFPPHFKYKDLALLAPLLKEGDYMTTINLKDGFFHVPVLPSHQAYMSFQWEGKIYWYQVLPFGMSSLPWLFTRFAQAMVHHLCCQGVQVMAYMDDFIVIGHSQWQALKHTTLTLHLLNQLGWQVNFKKSDLMPSQSKEFLGLVNTTGPPPFKVPPLKSHALWLNINRVPVWKLATVISQGVALTKAILLAKLLLCNAYHDVAQRAKLEKLHIAVHGYNLGP